MIHYQRKRETKIKKYQKEIDNNDSLLANQRRVNIQTGNMKGNQTWLDTEPVISLRRLQSKIITKASYTDTVSYRIVS